MSRAVDVVVVGAGLAGLVATSHLHEQGLDVVCLEARDRVGGRSSSESGLDLGATWFWDGQAAIADLVAATGVVRYPQVLEGDALFEQPDGTAVRAEGNPIDRPAWRLEGGMQALSIELARRLPVQTGSAVRAISFDTSATVTTGSATLSAEMVVLAVPPALAVDSVTFEPALPAPLEDAARAVHTWMSDTVKVVALYDEPFWRRDGLAGAALSHAGPFCEFHDHTGPDGRAALFGFAPATRLGGAGTSEIAHRFLEHAARLFGGAARAATAVHVADWSTERFTSARTPARPSTAWYYGTPVLRLPHYDGRLVFGSTETAPAFPGYLEGAVLAGRRAAAQALDALART